MVASRRLPPAGADRAGYELAQTRIAALESELDAYASRSARAYDAIGQLRDQLQDVRLAVAAPAPADANPVSGDPDRVPADPDPVPGDPDPVPGPPAPAGPIEADRLEAARSRLREAVAEQPAPVPERIRASRPWLASALASMLERDPLMSGRLVLALLPAQRLVHAAPLAYDLVLADRGCIQVTVAGDYWSVEERDSPRSAGAVQFRLDGDLPSLARLVAARRIRRGLRRSGARLTGDRRAARAMLSLVKAPLSISELVAAGVVVDPPVALALAAAMIEPAWTRGERFTIGFSEPDASTVQARLEVRDGAAPAIGEGEPSEPLSATIVCPPDSLLAVLDGTIAAATRSGPDERAIAVVQGWMKRAQSG